MTPDQNIVIEAPDNPDCKPYDTPLWMSRDKAADAVKHFCGDPNHLQGSMDTNTVQKYFDGSSDEVVITLDWSQDHQKLSQDNCTQFLMTTVDTCSAPVRRRSTI